MRLTFLLFLFGWVSVFSVQAQGHAELKKAVDDVIRFDTEIQFDRTPGMLIALIDYDSNYCLSYGSSRIDTLLPLDRHHIFEIGSMSKIFTATVLARMVDKGLLAYDDKVNEWLGEEFANPNAGTLTIDHLLTHSSGLPRLPRDFGLRQQDPLNPYADYTKEDLLGYYATFPFKETPGLAYNYSHTNFALLEIILEMVAKRPFEELLHEYLLSPLEMTETYLGINEKLTAKAAQGYTLIGKPIPFKTYASFEGSMGVKSSLNDLFKLMRVYLGMDRPEWQKFLKPLLEEKLPTLVKDNISVGRGWHMAQPNKKFYSIYMHPGRVTGHQVSLQFVPETKTASIVLANSEAELDNIGMMVLALANNHWRLNRKFKKRIAERK